MSAYSFGWAGPLGWAGAVAFLAVAGGLGPWLYRKALRESAPAARWLAALRGVALLAAMLFLLQPVVGFARVVGRDATVLVVVDGSGSSGVEDQGGSSRLAAAWKLVVGEDAPLAPIREAFAVEGVLVGAEPQDVSDPLAGPVPRPDGGSDLAGALQRAAARERAQDLEAVVLLTDGRETGTGSLESTAANLGVPIYVVGLGDEREPGEAGPDLSLGAVGVDAEVFVGTTVEARCIVRNDTEAAVETRIEVRRPRGVDLEEDLVVAERNTTLPPGQSEWTLSWVARDVGLFEFEAVVAPAPGEKVTVNNRRRFLLRVTSDKVRVFLYEGTLRWTYKFLRQALEQDPGVALTAVVRTNVDRTYAQGKALDLPASVEGLQAYEVIVLGDLAPEEMPAGTVSALVEYVNTGGSLLVLAGKKSFGSGGWATTSLAAILPAAPGGGGAVAEEVAFLPTPAGASHPVLRGAVGRPGGGLTLATVYPLAGVKPGAEVLVEAGGDPVVVCQRYGEGRVGLFASDTAWKWFLGGSETGRQAYVALWGQWVRWLASRDEEREIGESFAVTTDREVYGPGEPVTVRATFGTVPPSPLPAVTGEVRADSGGAPAWGLVFVEGALGREVVWSPPRGGVYTVTARPEGDAARELSTRFAVEHPRGEMDRLSRNTDLLRRVADTTGGAFLEPSQAGDLPDALGHRIGVRSEEGEWSPTGSPLAFLFFLAVLVAEWALRRRTQVI